ncbi:hypothetical protein ACFQAS_01315 [Halopenitus salinus]|uniref:TOBE domain-containing protein n=1 Tax=Halopenitus salinus TaxID=1198295 RepID=A0ABD5V066_9EURY
MGQRENDRRGTPSDPDHAGIDTTVSLHEPLGDEVLMYLDGPQGELRTVMPVDSEIDEGKHASIVPRVESLYLFNEKTGERFVRGDLQSDATAEVVSDAAN